MQDSIVSDIHMPTSPKVSDSPKERPHQRDLPPPKKYALMERQRKELGASRPRAENLPDAIREAVANTADVNAKSLNLCIAVDKSASMGDDIDRVKQHIGEIQRTLQGYPEGVHISWVEFGQRKEDGPAPKLRVYQKLDGDTLPRVVNAYQPDDSYLEPRRDAIAQCLHLLGISNFTCNGLDGTPADGTDSSGVRRKVVVLTDEPGDELPHSPSVSVLNSLRRSACVALSIPYIPPADFLMSSGYEKIDNDIILKRISYINININPIKNESLYVKKY